MNIKKQLWTWDNIFTGLLALKGERKLYLVGGAIRDILLNRPPEDFDFAIEGSGIEFARKFAEKVKGTFILLSKRDDEARVVHSVSGLTFDFSGLADKTIEEDLKRRDFTLNALAVELDESRVEEEKVIDPLGGFNHLTKGVIYPVGKESLKQDPLRLLRAFRLSLELDFKIDEKILDLARGLSLTGVAPERISGELLRIMEKPKSFKYFRLLVNLGILPQIFPEAKTFFESAELLNHSLFTYEKIEQLLSGKNFFSRFPAEGASYFNPVPRRKALLKLAGFFHDLGKLETRFVNGKGEAHYYGHDTLGAQKVEQMMKERLRLSNKETLTVKALVARHMHLHLLATSPVLTDRAIRRFFRLPEDEYFGLMILTYADGYATAGKIAHLEAAIERMIRLKQEDTAKAKMKRLVTGHDLISLGLKPGPIFKELLQEMEDLRLEGKIETREEGIAYLKGIICFFKN